MEGAELEVLKGASQTLEASHPKVVLEAHSFGPPSDALRDELVRHGYEVIVVPYREGGGMIDARQ